MRHISSALALLAPLLLLSTPALAKKKSSVPTAEKTSASEWAPPISDNGYQVRAGFDTDPSDKIGRFFTPGQPVTNDTQAMELACSKYITPKIVDAGGVVYDEYFSSSSEASAKIGIPAALRASGAAGQQTLVRVRYELLHKMTWEINDAQAFEKCCLAAPNQCTDRYVGEFLEGTGKVFYAMGTTAELKTQGITTAALAEFEMKDGRYWRSSLEFPRPVYFAFSVSPNTHLGGASSAGLKSGRCEEVEWDDIPPQSSQGYYFIGVSKIFDNEQSARTDAHRNARELIVQWAAEQVTSKSSSTTRHSGAAGSVSSATTGADQVDTSASGLVERAQDQAYCTSAITNLGEGPRYQVRVAAFLPVTQPGPQ